jgi:Small subunit of serine palmitoyltransferase-like
MLEPWEKTLFNGIILLFSLLFWNAVFKFMPTMDTSSMTRKYVYYFTEST